MRFYYLGHSLTACQSMTGKAAGETMEMHRLQLRLTKDKLSNFSHIDVDTDRGVVTLSGLLNTAEEKARAT